jgi:hypothetical protein
MTRTRPQLLVLAFLLGCTFGPPSGTRAPGEEIRVTNDVVVTFSDAVRELPFDTTAARLRAASEQLAAIAGHRVEFSFDRALLPQYQEEFQAMLIASIESTALDLDRLRELDTFPQLVAVLQRIELTYDVAAHEGIGWTSDLDIDAKTLRIRLDGDQAAFVPRGLVWNQLASAEPEILRRMFEGRTVASLAPAEQARYFRWLLHEARRVGYDDPATADALRDHPSLPWIVRAMELHARAEDPALRTEIADWITDRGGAFFYGHLRQSPAAVAALPPASPYVRTQQAWVAWVHDSAPSLRDHTLGKLLHRMLRDDPDRMMAASEPNPRALSGLDPLDFGFAIADRWIAAGHPLAETAEHAALYREVLCPVDVAALARPVVRSCTDDFYRYAWKDPPTRDRWVAGLLARGDEPLLRSGVAAIRDIGSASDVLELWRRVDADARAWRSMAMELALQEPEGLGGELVDDVQERWRRQPARRGTLLYLLAQHAREGYRQERFWPAFPEDFGRVDASTFTSFLGHGPLAVATVWVVWPALGSYPRGAPLANHLDVLFDAPPVDDRRGYRPPLDAIEVVVELMCREPRRGADLDAVRRGLRARAGRHPEERKDIVRLELATDC